MRGQILPSGGDSAYRQHILRLVRRINIEDLVSKQGCLIRVRSEIMIRFHCNMNYYTKFIQNFDLCKVINIIKKRGGPSFGTTSFLKPYGLNRYGEKRLLSERLQFNILLQVLGVETFIFHGCDILGGYSHRFQFFQCMRRYILESNVGESLDKIRGNAQ
jgi:hypothetical protein